MPLDKVCLQLQEQKREIIIKRTFQHSFGHPNKILVDNGDKFPNQDFKNVL